MYNQIKYRENVMRGTITAVNNNGTYNVRFKCESQSYPNVPTYAKNSNLQIGDRVTVFFENRNKEMPKILAFADNYGAEDNRVKHSDEILAEVLVAETGIYVVYKKASDSKYYLVRINDDDSVTSIAELAELATGTSPQLVRILTDSSGNVYALKQTESGIYFIHTLYKYNSSGTLQVTKVLSPNEMFGFITSDYLYTMIANDDEIRKRSLTDLETVDTINLTAGHRFYYLCFDNSGYLYTYDRDYTGEAAFIKWEIGVGISEFHQNGQSSISAWADFSLLGSNIAHDYFNGQYMATLATSLTSDMTTWTMNDIPTGQAYGVASNASYWYVLGQNTADNKLIVEKYDSGKALQATIDISSDYVSGKTYSAVTAYPF